MTSPTAGTLEQLDQLLETVCASAEIDAQFDQAAAAELVEVLLLAGRVQRRVDAVVTTVTATVTDRDHGMADDEVSSRAGCRDATELLRRTLRVDAPTARRYVAAGRGVHRHRQLSTGEGLPAQFEALGQALRDGVLSVTGFLAATGPLAAASSRIGRDELSRADQVLADAARGLDLTDDAGRAGPAPTTDELSALAHHIVLLLDPDGNEPDDERANRNRGLSLGREREGIVPIRGGLLPDVAGQLQRLLDSLLNPKVGGTGDAGAGDGADAGYGAGGVGSRVSFTDAAPESDPDADADADADRFGTGDLPDPPDPRSPAQKRHDAFASILTTAAGSGGFPTLGGAAPTLVVSVSADDYRTGTGRATVAGTGSNVPMGVAHQTACGGGIQRVMFDEHGQIVGIGTSARIFNALQRRAIVLRDRECLIPGCHIPANWCEIHHVIEHSRGGPTHTSNGVALCWFHHRSLDTSGWQIRVRHGTPEIRGPFWWDPYGNWHRPRVREGTRQVLADALHASSIH